jgi:uncharacterized protein (TIGR02145 family)
MTAKYLAMLSFAFIACSSNGAYDWVYDGETVEIGTQIWMAKNLDYNAKGSKCYENIRGNCAKYGRLYNWETAMKICPNGWHLPSNEDWEKLFRFVDGDTSSRNPYSSETAGKHLKAVSGWDPYDGVENLDTYGFSALPGGYYLDDSFYGVGFHSVGSSGLWWSAGKDSDSYTSRSSYTYLYGMFYYDDSALWGHDYMSALLSVRCLQD